MTDSPARFPVGFIGLGVMGRPMALNLIKAGHALVVHSRSAPPVEALVAAGATAAASPAEVAARTEVVITMLPDSGDVDAVLRGPTGVFSALAPGGIVIDMSTISPVLTRELAADAESRGVLMLDAPVSGGEIGAIDGTLSIMVGGDAGALARVGPLLGAMGHPERITHIGPSGAGQLAKACNQLVIAATLAGVSEAFALSRKAGVDPALVRRALLGGFAASRVLDVHGERILEGNFVPGFRTKLFDKDLRIVAETLATYEVAAPVTAAARGLVQALMERAGGELDYSAVARVVFADAGLERD